MSITLSVLYQESYWFYLNTTVCPCIPSEGFVWTITCFLTMTTSYLDRVYFGGD